VQQFHFLITNPHPHPQASYMTISSTSITVTELMALCGSSSLGATAKRPSSFTSALPMASMAAVL